MAVLALATAACAAARPATRPAAHRSGCRVAPASRPDARLAAAAPSRDHHVHRRHLDHRSRRGALQVVAARVEQEDIPLGTQAPDFELPEPLTGKSVKLSEYVAGAPATLIMFICNHCPFVVHLKPAMTQLAKEYQAKGVRVLAISSNSVETHPQDGPDKMAEDAAAQGYTFPYLFDESQDVAKAYTVACTPEFFVFDAQRRLTYHGQFDDSRPSKYGGNIPVTGDDLRHALDATLAGKPLERPMKNSIGCNLKWHPGKAPAWFHG